MPVWVFEGTETDLNHRGGEVGFDGGLRWSGMVVKF